MGLNIGQVISGTFGTVGSRFGGLLGIWLSYFAIQIVLMLVAFGLVGAQFEMLDGSGIDTLENPLAMGVAFFLMIILVYIAYITLSFATQVSMTHYASPLHSSDFGSAFMSGMRTLLTALGMTLLFIVGYFLIAILFGILGFVLAAIGESLALIGNLVFLVAALYLAARLIVAFPVISVEGERNPISAMTRSWSMTRGHTLPIFLTLLVFAIIVIVAAFVIITVLGGGMAAVFAGGAMDPDDMAGVAGGIIVMLLVFAVFGAIITMISTSFMAHVHAKLSPTASVTATFE